MRVSVILPAYNSQMSINKAIDSILKQSYKDIEIIIVDDGSTDSTRNIVQEYSTQIHYFYQGNAGVCAARNKGVELANGQWIAFIDHDDEWHCEKISRQIKIVKDNSSLRWCATNYYYDDGHQRVAACNPNRAVRFMKGKDFVSDFFIALGKNIIRIMPTTVLISKEAYHEVGGFQDGLKRCEDTDLWCRMGMKYQEMGYLPEPLATRYLEIGVPADVAELRRKAKTGEDMRAILAKYFDDARNMDRLESYDVFVQRPLRRTLLTCLYNQHPEHAKATVREFKRVLPWHWRFMVKLLTLCPRFTTICAYGITLILRRLKLDKHPGRRWIERETEETAILNR